MSGEIECPFCGHAWDGDVCDLTELHRNDSTTTECTNEDCGKEFLITTDISYDTHKPWPRPPASPTAGPPGTETGVQ